MHNFSTHSNRSLFAVHESMIDSMEQLYNIESTFFEAEDLCVAQGGHLPSIHSKEENELIYWLTTNGQAATKESDHTWIGLRRKLFLWNYLTENQKNIYDEWVWTDGTPVDYIEWAPNQPDNFDKSESCAQMFNAATGTVDKQFDEMAWNDIKCSTKMKSFVCKFKNQ
ncbi:lectin C-type domain protein [Teladorsagia circumcincta]|uniref:Lectin C-type domain protein n=1 Tax=Teladorsagia circumcincta TaxID=45464 RepID=A0A2G9UZR3_TELCI|nr:lectin C-type domain protein [Teladorsagia circumcincta]